MANVDMEKISKAANGWPSNTPPEVSQTNDPAPSVTDVARERMEHLLNSVTTHTLEQLRELRDEIDNVIRSIQHRNERVLDVFNEHVQHAADAIQTKLIIQDSLAKIKKNFG